MHARDYRVVQNGRGDAAATRPSEAELRSSLQEAQDKVDALQAEVQRLKAGRDSCAGPKRSEVPEDRIYSTVDLDVFDEIPLVVHIVDWHTDRKQILWGNKETLKIFARASNDELRKIDLSKASEQMKHFQKEMYKHVQVEKKVYGPERRVMPLPSGSAVFDVMQCPIRFQVPGVEANKDHVYAQFMLERVSSMAILFAQETGELVQMNTATRAHFSTVIGEKECKDMCLRDVLEALVWEEATEIEATLAKINELDIGGGAVVIERAVAPRSDSLAEASQGTAAEKWLNLKFIASLDPTPGQAQRIAVLVSGQDVSEQRQARADLLHMSNQQEQFFAEMAHELRTPLHCISGLSESMMRDSTCPLSLQKSLSIIHSQGMRLAAMVSDIVDSASNMRRTLLIKHEELALHTVAQSTIETMSTLVKRGVKLVNEVPLDLPVVQADSSRLFQVLVNLVSNSLRFTSKGHVKISGRRLPGAPIPSVEITVSDTGLGIPADKLAGIFEAFQQVDAGTTRKYGGSGLGLALVKTLVEAHHGSVRVESQHRGLGSGTTFSITLPVLQPHSLSRSCSVSIASKDSAELAERVEVLREEERIDEADEEAEEEEGARAKHMPAHTLQAKLAVESARHRALGAASAHSPEAPHARGPLQDSESPPAHRAGVAEDGMRRGRGEEERARNIQGMVMQRALEHAWLAREASERREELTFHFARERDAATRALLAQLIPPGPSSGSGPPRLKSRPRADHDAAAAGLSLT